MKARFDGQRTRIVMEQKTDWSLVVPQALLAGLVAGITIDAYLIVTQILPAHESPVQLWQWVASAVLGQVAFSSPSYALAGLIAHFCVSIGWAGGYAYLARQQPFLNRRWAISGLVYGVVVYIFMDILLLGVRMFTPPSPLGLINALVAHCVFFGLPLAYVVSRMDRT